MFREPAAIGWCYDSGITIAELENGLESRIYTGASELLEADVAHAAERGGDDEIVENNQDILKVRDNLLPGAMSECTSSNSQCIVCSSAIFV
ncbi:MAG: hypothetical protein ABSC54_07605 [Smithellaceae bacterium]